jgi:hypothetical protein
MEHTHNVVTAPGLTYSKGVCNSALSATYTSAQDGRKGSVYRKWDFSANHEPQSADGGDFRRFLQEYITAYQFFRVCRYGID